jgi:serine/threonine protein phosphatase PrpC
VTADPEITTFNINEDLDYVFMACDGIFDVLTNEEVNGVIWETVAHHKSLLKSSSSLQSCLNDCVNNVLKQSLIQHSEDNITAIMIAFRNLLE